MADELSLKIKCKSIEEGKLNKIEYIVGKDEQSLEPVGIMTTLDYKSLYYLTYKTYTTEKIKSFHIRNDALEKFSRELTPGQEVMLRTGDHVGWGLRYPEVVLEISYTPKNEKDIN